MSDDAEKKSGVRVGHSSGAPEKEPPAVCIHDSPRPPPPGLPTFAADALLGVYRGEPGEQIRFDRNSAPGIFAAPMEPEEDEDVVRDQRDRAVALLRKLEFPCAEFYPDGGGDYPSCGICKETAEVGHTADCPLAALLAEVSGSTAG